jgi:hypothetical protein
VRFRATSVVFDLKPLTKNAKSTDKTVSAFHRFLMLKLAGHRTGAVYCLISAAPAPILVTGVDGSLWKQVYIYNAE